MKEIFERVSIRRYEERPVEEEKLEALLRAAMAAPSAGNQQPWEFYVIRDRELLERLSKVSPYAGCTGKAPAAIVSAYREKLWAPAYAQIDMSIAMENLWLSCGEQGLGGVWLGIAPVEERMRAVEEIVGSQKASGPLPSSPWATPPRAEPSRTDGTRSGSIGSGENNSKFGVRSSELRK